MIKVEYLCNRCKKEFSVLIDIDGFPWDEVRCPHCFEKRGIGEGKNG